MVDNLNSNLYIKEVLMSYVTPFFQRIPGVVFQLDSARPHIDRNVQAFFSTQQIEPLSCPAYSSYIPSIEHI